MTKHPDLFAALARPFSPHEVKTRSQNGKTLSYVTASTVANRLDNAAGPENWWDRYRPGGESSIVCALTVRLPDGTEVTKEDAGGSAGMADAGDDDKSAFSDAFKRAAAKFGVGRLFRGDGVPDFVHERTAAGGPAPASQARPAPTDLGWVHQAPAVRLDNDMPPVKVPANGRTAKPVVTVELPAIPAPKTGSQFFKWAKVQEERYGVGLIKYLTQWGKLQSFAGRIVDWNAEQVALGLAEAQRKLASIATRGEAYDGEPSVN